MKMIFALAYLLIVTSTSASAKCVVYHYDDGGTRYECTDGDNSPIITSPSAPHQRGVEIRETHGNCSPIISDNSSSNIVINCPRQ